MYGDTGKQAPITKRALFKQVADQLRTMIVAGDLEPGQKIPEGQLCEQFGISRTPLREALKVLAAEELVELLPNRGAQVSVLETSHISELFESIAIIEGAAAELAAKRMTDEDIEDLTDLHDQMASQYRRLRRKRYFDLNQQVHSYIVGQAKNETLRKLHAQLMLKVTRARFFAILSQERWDTSMRQHEEILEALRAKKATQAGKLLRKHVEETGETVCGALAEGGSETPVPGRS